MNSNSIFAILLSLSDACFAIKGTKSFELERVAHTLAFTSNIPKMDSLDQLKVENYHFTLNEKYHICKISKNSFLPDSIRIFKKALEDASIEDEMESILLRKFNLNPVDFYDKVLSFYKLTERLDKVQELFYRSLRMEIVLINEFVKVSMVPLTIDSIQIILQSPSRAQLNLVSLQDCLIKRISSIIKVGTHKEHRLNLLNPLALKMKLINDIINISDPTEDKILNVLTRHDLINRNIRTMDPSNFIPKELLELDLSYFSSEIFNLKDNIKHVIFMLDKSSLEEMETVRRNVNSSMRNIELFPYIKNILLTFYDYNQNDVLRCDY